VSGDNARRPIQLFHQHRAGQHVGPCRLAEGDGGCGRRAFLGRQAISRTNQEAELPRAGIAPMLDLLGKNDTLIATSAPHGAFFPGHNKWDYNYSIGELQPDVIFQTFDRGLEKNLHQRITNWGYKKMCPITGTFGSRGYYYRTNSKQIKWDSLQECL
jgi:hypothetical protein